MTDKEFPAAGDEYIHTETDDLVSFIGRDDGQYHFSVNGGDRHLSVDAEDWPTYRGFLVER